MNTRFEVSQLNRYSMNEEKFCENLKLSLIDFVCWQLKLLAYLSGIHRVTELNCISFYSCCQWWVQVGWTWSCKLEIDEWSTISLTCLKDNKTKMDHT